MMCPPLSPAFLPVTSCGSDGDIVIHDANLPVSDDRVDTDFELGLGNELGTQYIARKNMNVEHLGLSGGKVMLNEQSQSSWSCHRDTSDFEVPCTRTTVAFSGSQ